MESVPPMIWWPNPQPWCGFVHGGTYEVQFAIINGETTTVTWAYLISGQTHVDRQKQGTASGKKKTKQYETAAGEFGG